MSVINHGNGDNIWDTDKITDYADVFDDKYLRERTIAQYDTDDFKRIRNLSPDPFLSYNYSGKHIKMLNITVFISESM